MPRERGGGQPPKETKKEILRGVIDISKAWDNVSMHDIIIEKIKELGIYHPDLLYRGFDGTRINIVKKQGTDVPDSDTVFCSTESELVKKYELGEQSAIDFALDNDQSGLSIYDGNKLMYAGRDRYEYQTKPSFTLKDALIAVFILKTE